MGSKSRVAAGSMKRSEESASKKRFVGVRQRPSGRWVAEIKDTTQKIRLWLGTFDSAEEGAKAYDSAARALRGANTRTNFVTALSSCETTSSKATRLIRLRQIAAANAKLQAEAGVRRDVNPQPTCSSNSDEDEQRHSQSLLISSPPPKLASRENAPSDSCLVDSEHIDPVFYEHLAASPPPSSPSPSPPSPPPPLCCNSTSEVAVLASSAVSAFSCSSESSSLHSCASSSGASSSSSDDPLDACIPWSDYVLVDGLDHLPLYASMAFDFSAEAMERDSCSTSLLEDHTSASLRDSDEFPHFNVAMSTSETSSDLDRHVDDAEICSTSHDLVWCSRSYRGRRHAAT